MTGGNDTDTHGHVPWNRCPSLTGRARTEDLEAAATLIKRVLAARDETGLSARA